MNMRAFCHETIATALSVDAEERLLSGFDYERNADSRCVERGEIYAFAFGVFREFPGNPIYKDMGVWDVVQRTFDVFCDQMHDDGQWDWYVPATKKTHPIPRPFGFFEWLRVFEEFGEHFDAARRTRIEKMLRTSLAWRMGQAERVRDDLGNRNASLNILAHVMLQLWYGGRLFGQDDWMDAGAGVMDRIVALQKPGGWWHDSRVERGPTVLYNTVTLENVAHYAHLSGNVAAREAIVRAADYHFHMAYPDGSLVETADERNRHRQGAGGWRLIPSLANFEETMPVAAYFAERIAPLLDEAAERYLFPLASSLCDTVALLPEGDVAPQKSAASVSEFAMIPALAERRAPWHLCLSGATTDFPGGMFHHDLQNHLSLWHDDAGLIIGGGNSYQDAPFSTFRFGGHYLADSGVISREADTSVLELQYGDTEAKLTVTLENDSTARFDVSTTGSLPQDSDFAIHLPYRFGGMVEVAGHEIPLDNRSIHRGAGGGEGAAIIGPLRLESDGPLLISWPHLPVNIYNLPMRLPVEEGVVRVSVRLVGEPVSLRLTVVAR
jgi:hypothetical protein